MKEPTFTLPACPVCSSIIVVVRPFWKYAANTSKRTGQRCYMFSGCQHAVPVNRTGQILQTPEEWQIVEENWAHAAEQLFIARTENWTEVQRARFKRDIETPHTLPSVADRLPGMDAASEVGTPPTTNHEAP